MLQGIEIVTAEYLQREEINRQSKAVCSLLTVLGVVGTLAALAYFGVRP